MINIFIDSESGFVAIGGLKLLVPRNLLEALVSSNNIGTIDIRYKVFPEKYLFKNESWQNFRKENNQQAGTSIIEVVDYLNSIFSVPYPIYGSGYLEYHYQNKAVVEVQHNLGRYVNPLVISDTGEVRSPNVPIHQTRDKVTVDFTLPESGKLVLYFSV